MPGPADTYIGYGLSWANASNTPYREYKHWVHEGGISTPLIAHWPNGVDESCYGKLESQPGHLIDLMATSEAVRAEARVYLPWIVAAPIIGVGSWMLVEELDRFFRQL